MVKKFLDPVTVSKIHILGGSYQKELLAQIPAENLPKHFGGTCQCAEGCELSDQGPWQDSQYSKTPAWAKKDDAIHNNPDQTLAGEGQGGIAAAGPGFSSEVHGGVHATQ